MGKAIFKKTITRWVRFGRKPVYEKGIHIIGIDLFFKRIRIPLYEEGKKNVVTFTYLGPTKYLDYEFFTNLSNLIGAHNVIDKLTFNWCNFVKYVLLPNTTHICENLGLNEDKLKVFLQKGYIILKDLKLDMIPLPSGKFRPTFKNFLKLNLDYIEI